MSVEFENINVRIEITRFYSVTGAPHISRKLSRTDAEIAPVSVKFIFVDGDFNEVVMHGKIVCRDGRVSERVIKVPSIWSWNQAEWPEWMHELRDMAFQEYAKENLSR